MKTPLLVLAAFPALIISCGYKPVPVFYSVEFPPLPSPAAALLGTVRWRLEYYDSKGNVRHKEITPRDSFKATADAKIDVLQEWPGAILAWPYWPEKNLAAGCFCPAGAIFPLDASGEVITLSWQAGAEGYFFRELEKAQGLNAGTNRIPAYFDWKRFRTLLREHDNAELRGDPWLADWQSIAEKTVRSGFRQSYVQAERKTAGTITIPHDGPWVSASPFRKAELWAADEEIVLMLSPRPEMFVCSGGILSVSSGTRLWLPY